MLNIISKLKQKGILGINRRNAVYVFENNSRSLYQLVDDKLRTKKLAQDNGITIPQLYGTIRSHRAVKDIHGLVEQYSDFVIKPAHGSGGNGILIISGRSKDAYKKVSGNLLDREDIEHYVSNILSGMYSLGGQTDVAMIEFRVKISPVFESISYLGTPDIRIIVFRGVPVMAMARLPTRMSDGRANLHQGAIGAGIDVTTGVTTFAVWGNETITEHPDTDQSIRGVEIPDWEHLLSLSSKCYDITGLGYLGVDIVLDENQGPMVLELNARPGLNIQIANMAGLEKRLRIVESKGERLANIDQRVVFAKKYMRHS
ncbi:MAG TPA: alpha-L-glutamate ligase-like protein [Nitrospirae bacterium]|nr:alpha-L-glutamate ligase-like protein [Nitrospirota bacterium]